MTRVYKILLFVVALVFVLNTSCKNGCPLIKRPEFLEPSANFKDKFEIASKWIPEDTNIIVALDIYKISDSDFFKKYFQADKPQLLKWLGVKTLDITSDIGTTTILADFATKGELRGPVILIQGAFNENLVVSKIESAASAGDLKLKEEKYKERTLYTEEGEPDHPFSFCPLSDGVIAIGPAESLKWVIDTDGKGAARGRDLSKGVNWMRPIWGRADIGGLARSRFAAPWNNIVDIELVGDIAGDVAARISLVVKNTNGLAALKKAVEGLLALETIEKMNDPSAMRAINNIQIDAEKDRLIVQIPEDANLLHIIFGEEIKDESNKSED